MEVYRGALAATHLAFTLYMICMDGVTAAYVEELSLSNVRIVPPAQLEEFNRGLAAVKPSRSAVEYSWTATPVVCLYCLHDDPVSERATRPRRGSNVLCGLSAGV